MSGIIRILYERYIGLDNKRMIGGIESYIESLCQVCLSINRSPIVYFYSENNIVQKYHQYVVVGVTGAKNSRDLIKYIDKNDNPNYSEDVLIFATDFMITKNKYSHSIAIQHGVAWDITTQYPVSEIRNLAQIIKGTLRSLKKYFRYRYCNNIVCVDYNFVNWYRTQVLHIDMNLFIIPNYANINHNKEMQVSRASDHVSVVFARRFVEYRGTKLFANAIIEVTKQHPEIDFVLAGDGPDEKWLHDKLKGYKNVSFTKYNSEDSISFHSNYDIAVVPTEGSEGTSLSLLEAMSAGCAVIATNVGGMTNIILDGYNGLMVSPDVNELKAAIVHLIENKELRAFLSRKAQETVRKSFSYEKWKNSWIKVIQAIENE